MERCFLIPLMYAPSICITLGASTGCSNGSKNAAQNVPVDGLFIALTFPRLMRYVGWDIIIVQTLNKTTISGNDRATPEFQRLAFTAVNLEKFWQSERSRFTLIYISMSGFILMA